MYSGVEQHVRRRIAAAPIVDDPFPHQVISDVFPAEYYRLLLDTLPSRETYTPLGETGVVPRGAYRERFICDLADLAASEMDSDGSTFWRDLIAWLMHDRFRDFLIGHYARYVAERFGADTGLNAVIDARIIRDETNYALGPHTDSTRKLISLLFYLPRDASLRHLGTSIYAPLAPSFRCAGGPHHAFEKFRRLSTTPYVPNTLFVFFKTDRSFHGVEPVKDEGIERNLLLYNIYAETAAQAPRSRFRLSWPGRRQGT